MRMQTPSTCARWRNAGIIVSCCASLGSASVRKYLGFKLYDTPDLDKAEAFFRAKGLPVEWVERPFMGRTLRTCDPFGVPLEFYVQMDRLPPIHQQYALYKGVKPLRIDHFNMFASDVDASVAFYTELGFRTTEYTEDDESGTLVGRLDAPQGRRA
jgi:catechol 2,3-dioxygenase